ncbi:hypothetical protein BMS3Abin15_00614 [bacterium BMS3Abin15]|nr:hypothetical protein BMS3Abin15_00614 [bacterium BMS3Abin15]HDH07592.1 hypothetical protein [Candidatus Moranbacteria bacterium]HDZ85652.1 hypothetical protein [Candidatus Moranbacteria bacterium]
MKKLLVVIAFIIVFLILLDIFIEGPAGVSPLGKGCAGFQISSNNFLLKNAPDGNIAFKYPFSFHYEMNREISDQTYCLGKNFYGFN